MSQPNEKTRATIAITSKGQPIGEIVLRFFHDVAPGHAQNFTKLAKEGFYNGTTFHRVIPGFMIQGGDPTGTGRGGPGYRFADECRGNPLRHGAKVLSMANSGPDTNGSQFFIVIGNRGMDLPPNYSLFGQVTDGLDTTVNAIALTADETAVSEAPTSPVTIESITITES